MSARIVSLVPSLTELIWWFGLQDALVGRTRFCVEPRGEVERVLIVGGTKNPRVAKVLALRPDLVIANKEENRREDVEALRAAGLRVLVTDPNTVPEAVAMVRELGAELGCRAKAETLAAATEAALAEPPPARKARVFVAVWKDPLMGLGCASYGHDLLEAAGAVNVLGGQPRYPATTLADVAQLRPNLVLLPDEPFPFRERDLAAFAAVAPARLLDGKLLWWYGPRMPGAIRELRAIFADAASRE
ncbi:MAG: helical backbone metal receptor [Tepidiformaceae bacterium]